MRLGQLYFLAARNSLRPLHQSLADMQTGLLLSTARALFRANFQEKGAGRIRDELALRCGVGGDSAVRRPEGVTTERRSVEASGPAPLTNHGSIETEKHAHENLHRLGSCLPPIAAEQLMAMAGALERSSRLVAGRARRAELF